MISHALLMSIVGLPLSEQIQRRGGLTVVVEGRWGKKVEGEEKGEAEVRL